MIIPNIWENNIDVPNHQPVNHSVAVLWRTVPMLTPSCSQLERHLQQAIRKVSGTQRGPGDVRQQIPGAKGPKWNAKTPKTLGCF